MVGNNQDDKISQINEGQTGVLVIEHDDRLIKDKAVVRIVTGRQVGNRQVCEVQEGGMDEADRSEM